MADDGFFIDIFSNDDDFGQISAAPKGTSKGASGLSMVSGYATDESDSNTSLKVKDEKKLGYSEYQEEVENQSVIPMEIEDLEEGECLSDINPAAELEWIYDKEELHKDEQREVAAPEETPSKLKKKEKANKKKKKKEKEDKKTEKGKEKSKSISSSSRSHSKERKQHRRGSLESHKESHKESYKESHKESFKESFKESCKESKKGRDEGKRKLEHSSGRSKEVEEKRYDGHGNHSSRTPKRDRNRDWSGYDQFRGLPHQQEGGTTKHSSRKHRTSEKDSKQKPKGDRRRVERIDSSPDELWERRVRVVDDEGSSEGDSAHGRKRRHRMEKITVALDERVPKEKCKEGRRSEHRRSHHSKKESSVDLTLGLDLDQSRKWSHSETSRKKERKTEKRAKERKVVEESDGRRDRGRERLGGEGGMDVRGVPETIESKVKHKKRKRSISESGEKRKDKKKKKKKKKRKERSTEETAHPIQPLDGRKRAISIDRTSEKRPSISSDLVADRGEGIKDLDLEMRKDRECNTLDQRLQEIERRLALDTDISSDDELPDHHPKLEDIVFSESESRDKEIGTETPPVNVDSREDSCDAVKGEGSVEEEKEQVVNIANQPLSFEPEEEELSGEALFMKEYGLELEEGSGVEETQLDNREEKELWLVQDEDRKQGLDEDSSALEVASSMTDFKPSGFLPGFNLSAQAKNLNGTGAELTVKEKDDFGSSASKWKPVGGFTEVEEVSEEESVAALDPLPSTFLGANDVITDFGDVSKARDSDADQPERINSGLYESAQTLEEISDQEDIFHSIEQEEILTKDRISISPESKDLQTNVEAERKKWKPVGFTQVQALSQQLLLTPSDEYCDFKESDAKEVSPPSENEDRAANVSSRRRSSSDHKDSHRRRKDHREHEKRHRKTSEKGAKHSKHHETHQHAGDAKSEKLYQEEEDSPKEERHQRDKGATRVALEAPQKVERTADKYRKKPVRKEVAAENDEKGTAPSAVRGERDVRRRSKSKDKEEWKNKDRKRQDSSVKVSEKSREDVEDLTFDIKAQKPLSNERVHNMAVADRITASAGGERDNNRSSQKVAPKEAVHAADRKEITEKADASSEVARSSETFKEKKTKRQRSRDSESRLKDTEHSEPPAVEVRSKKKRRESSRKSKDDLFDDIFGNDGREEEERDAMASLLKDPEPFKKTMTDYESEGLVVRSKTKEKHHHRKKSEDGKAWKKEARRKRESESGNGADSGWKLSKLDSRNEVEKIPGIMDESGPSQVVVSTKETSNDGVGRGIPLLFDSLPKSDVLRLNSEEKENDSSSLFKGSVDSWNDGRGELPVEMSPYNPEDLSPIDLNDSPEEDFGLHGDSIAMAIESIEKKRETILANLNYETIMRQKAREHVRQRKSDITHVAGTSESKPTEQGMVDYLIRQSRVEDEMKTVLKEYYRKKEISKEEYKTILKKAVPQVTMSNSPIIPEKIRNLMKKFICKAKGQRILNEKKPNMALASGSGSGSKKKGYYKNFKPPKLPEPKPKEKKDSARKNSARSSSSGPGTQLKILNPNLPLPPML